jgi:hypothetical protein
MTTVNDVITEAMKKSGVLGLGQSVAGDDMVSALADFNDLVSQWNTKRWMVWDLVTLGYISTGTTSGYTVGPGGNFAVSVRPDRLESCFQRQFVNPVGLNVDTPIEIIPSREEYNRLSLKTLSSFALYAYYDNAYPTGMLYIYPWPQASIYEVFITFKNALPVFTAQQVGTVLPIPPHYIAAMKFVLAKRYRQAYGKGLRPDPELNAMARDALDTVKQSNLQVPELVMPKVLIIQSSGYNILSDQFGNA